MTKAKTSRPLAIGENADLTDDERCTFSILGVIRFDASAVAKALRSRPLTYLEIHGLANLLDGKRPDGISLAITGQGRNWRPIREGAQMHDRAIGFAKMMDELMASGESWEQATFATAEHFGVSESTVSRNVDAGRALQATER